MSFDQVLDELPAMTMEQRQLLIRRALELDDSRLSDSDMEIVEARLARHDADSSTSIPLDKMKERLRRFKS